MGIAPSEFPELLDALYKHFGEKVSKSDLRKLIALDFAGMFRVLAPYLVRYGP
jgi:hypothetical protein